MSRSPTDAVQIMAVGTPDNEAGFDFNFEGWTSFRLRSSIVGPAEASFELGDESGWERVARLCDLGSLFAVKVDERPRMVGRVHALTSRTDAGQSTNQSFVVRTALADAAYASAPHGLMLKGASVKDFVLACYSAVGLTEEHFDFRADVSRDLMTGRVSRGERAPVLLEPLTEEQAKVTPPESVFSAVDRHLRRHGLLHWDGADGRIIVASPDDQQAPIGSLRCRRGREAHTNNVLSLERTLDVSESPTVLGVFGLGGGASFAKSKIGSVIYNDDLLRRGFRRNVVIVDEAVKTKALAGGRARREYATRTRSLNRIVAIVDGLAARDGSELLPWSPDTVIDVVADPLGGALGAYYVEEVTMSRDPAQGDRTALTLVRQGVWVL